MMRRAGPIIIISLLLGLVFDWFFYDKASGITVFIFTSLVLGFTYLLAHKFKHPLNKSIYWLTPVTLFFSLMLFVRANGFLAFMNILLTMYLLIMIARLAHQPSLRLGQFKIFQYVSLLGAGPLSFVREFFSFLRRVFSNRNNNNPKSSFWPIVRGVILSLPILFIFLMLLSSADLVFKGYIEVLFSPSISFETIFRLFQIGFVTSLFMGAYALIFMPASPPAVNPGMVKKGFDLGTTEASIILGSVGALFFVFVTVQLAYLFGGTDQIVSTGYTYAEYARKGFFELITVAALTMGLILTGQNDIKHRTLLQTLFFKWLCGVLIAEVLIIMLSAHMRLSLYEEAYGFTMLRLLSHLFILWLAVAFSLLLLHIIKGNSAKRFAFQLFISLLCFFAVINIINPDDYIAWKNIKRFNEVGKLDQNHLLTLSADAVPRIAELLDHPNKKVQNSTAKILYYKKGYSQKEKDYVTGWQTTNLSRQRANKIYSENAEQIEAAKDYDYYQELNIN
ncbi:hypothetical protein BH23PAT1_BH23PAT1_4350 [soil metagenome]